MGYPHFYQSDGAYGTVMLYQWHITFERIYLCLCVVCTYTCVRTFKRMCLCSFVVMWKIFDIVKTVDRQNESFEKAFAKLFALFVLVRCVQWKQQRARATVAEHDGYRFCRANKFSAKTLFPFHPEPSFLWRHFKWIDPLDPQFVACKNRMPFNWIEFQRWELRAWCGLSDDISVFLR